MNRVVCVLVLLLPGCADEGRPPPAEPSDNPRVVIPREQVASGDPKNEIAVGPCEDGDVFQCRFYTKPHGNVQSCFVGEQRCVGGTWGDCGDAVEVDAAELEEDSSETDSANDEY